MTRLLKYYMEIRTLSIIVFTLKIVALTILLREDSLIQLLYKILLALQTQLCMHTFIH